MQKTTMMNAYENEQNFTGDERQTSAGTDPEPMTLSLKQLEQVLGISHNTAQKLAHTPGFPAFHIGKRVVINRAKLQEWMDRRCEAG